MKIPAKSPSRFLAQDDLPTPIVALMSHVTSETLKSARGQDQKFVLHFSGPVKPLKLNVTNQRTIIAAYGDESEHWRGRAIEIYWDPNVTYGSEVIGGVRVRIPTMPVAQPAAAPSSAAPAPAPTPALAPVQAPARVPERTLEDKHRLVMSGIASAKTLAKLDEWARWAHQFDFPEPLHEEQADAYHARKAALEQAQAQKPHQGLTQGLKRGA